MKFKRSAWKIAAVVFLAVLVISYIYELYATPSVFLVLVCIIALAVLVVVVLQLVTKSKDKDLYYGCPPPRTQENHPVLESPRDYTKYFTAEELGVHKKKKE